MSKLNKPYPVTAENYKTIRVGTKLKTKGVTGVLTVTHIYGNLFDGTWNFEKSISVGFNLEHLIQHKYHIISGAKQQKITVIVLK